MITPASFRTDFPEFADATNFPSATIGYYLALAGLLLNQSRWGCPGATVVSPPTTIYDYGVELFAAHHLKIEADAIRAAATGGTPGQVTGPVNSKSVGPVSISYAPGDVIIPDAGHWNLTVYGIRFRQLSRMRGAGPVQVGVGGWQCGPMFNNVPLNGPAWPGPFAGWGPLW